MAASNGGVATNPFGSKLELEAVQTVPPWKPTEKRQSIKVSLAENPSPGIYKWCFNVVLCYNKSTTSEKDAGVPLGSLVGGWIRESLGRALSEEPILAGRLKRNQDGQGDLEIVSNDSGVRLIEAQIEMNLSEFLELKDKKEAEAELVFWDDLDRDQNPQFSPLLYVQVTNFSCGGYSIGISCSILLIDPFAMMSFLKRWTDIHIEMVSRTDVPKIPIFYRRNLRKAGPSPVLPIGSNRKPYAGQSVIFTIATKVLNLDGETDKNIAALCIDEAEQKLGLKRDPSSNLSFAVKQPSEDGVTVRNVRRNDLVQKPFVTVNGITTSAKWDDGRSDEIRFQEGNKPAHLSCWINSVPDHACILIVPSENDSSGMKIVLAFPG